MKHPILYEDNHLLAVDKPPGLATQPAESSPDSLQSDLKAWLKDRDKKPGNVFLEPVHRLDKDVGGIVLFAKTSKALSRMNRFMRERKIEKFYRAEVEGGMTGEGVLKHQLLHGDRRAEVVEEGGKEALLRYKVLAQKGETTEVEIELLTGRYHQIRAQFGAVGHPVLGDRKYGSSLPFAKKGIALRHVRLCFPHPVKEGRVEIKRAV